MTKYEEEALNKIEGHLKDIEDNLNKLKDIGMKNVEKFDLIMSIIDAGLDVKSSEEIKDDLKERLDTMAMKYVMYQKITDSMLQGLDNLKIN